MEVEMDVGRHTFQQVAEDHFGMFSVGEQIASLYLDHRNLIDTVVIYSGTSYADELAALKIVVAQVLGDLGRTVHMDRTQLLEVLCQSEIACISDAAYSLTEALTRAIASERLSVPVQFEIGRPSNDRHLRRVTFRVEAPARFRAWHDLQRPGQSDGYHIVPGYHPCMNGRVRVGLVNGDTNAHVTGKAIHYVYAPEGSVSTRGFMTSWDHTLHPVYAAGQEIELQISEPLLLAPEGIKEIVDALVALLELENTFMAVSGGFRSPYEDAGVVAHLSGIRSASQTGEARGSEGHCVWAYHVLDAEGELASAHIPRWFIAEGWLAAYAQFSPVPAE
jgi:hypothetical protein